MGRLNGGYFDAYIQQFDESIQEKLYLLDDVIMQIIPKAQKKFSYQMPTYYLRKNIIHYAVNKHHIGIYPGPQAISHCLENGDLDQFKSSKGAIQIPLNRDIPNDLVLKLIAFNLQKFK